MRKRSAQIEPKIAQFRYKEAASYYRQASESVPKGNDLIWAEYLGMWGMASYESGAYSAAEKPLRRSLMINEKALGPDHPDVAASLNNLALLYYAQGKYGEAEPLYKRSLVMFEKALGPDHPHVAIVCKNMAELYRKIGKKEEADKLEERAGKISSIQ
jgi:tetratricopeptide (TPR) repeat protein